MSSTLARRAVLAADSGLVHYLITTSLVAGTLGPQGLATQRVPQSVLQKSTKLPQVLPQAAHSFTTNPLTTASFTSADSGAFWCLLLSSPSSHRRVASPAPSLHIPALHKLKFKANFSCYLQLRYASTTSSQTLASPIVHSALLHLAAAMPAPYSDNVYSDPDPSVSESHGVHDDDDTSPAATAAAAASALSPSDGYFHASADDDVSPTSRQPQQLQHHQQPTHPSHRSSASGPYVPNVLVEDPTLYSDPDTKAKLAHHLINNDASPAPSSSSPHPHHNPHSYYPSASPSVSGASIATPSTITTASYTQLPGRQPQSPHQFPSQNRQLHINTSPPLQPSNYNSQNFNGRADAPPAYTPSSPDNNPSHYNYSTFPSVTSPRMGVPEEHDRLLSPQQQQPFADPPKQPLWQRIKDSHDSGSLRHRIKRILGILVFVSIILVFLGFNMSGPEYRVSICGCLLQKKKKKNQKIH